MALRVLLADESVTIKKVIQLALQDFAVEVKAVPVGVDVLDVTKSFKPDLIFADILLQKRSGYDVCRDLKRDPETASLPVVLMWSSFMELDQAQLEATGADGKLEKPFDVETLRRLVLDLVPRTRTQRMAHFLDFPATVAAPLKSEEAERAKTYQPPVPAGDFEVAAPPPTGFTPAIPERPEAITLAPSEPEPAAAYEQRQHDPVPPTKEEPSAFFLICTSPERRDGTWRALNRSPASTMQRRRMMNRRV
ncbi:MAG: response regulator [Bdellovibrionales bacterium]|nr:response regulator [Bdellovibrionales bacterium]